MMQVEIERKLKFARRGAAATERLATARLSKQDATRREAGD
jgi:hypothetical protein